MGLSSRLYYLEKQVRELTNSLKKTAGSSPQDAAMSDAGMNTDLAVGGMGEFLGKVFAARVVDAADPLHGGHLKVICDQVHGEAKFTAKMATPFGGAGYGFFGVPGKGASVLITEVQGEGWVWFACLFNLEVEQGGKMTVVDPKGEGSESQKYEADDAYAKLGREEGDPMQMTHGVPESFLAYEENNQPEQYMWKTPKGNKIIMSEKHTENNEEKHITIQSAGGKRIILDDADARTEVGTEPSLPSGQTGDRIIIADGDEWEEEGGPNRIWIQSTAGEAGVEDSIQVYARNTLFLEAREGNINMTVLDSEVEDAHILITNLASGNLEMDIEEGDIAAAAKYRICLNAWNEDQELPHLGTIGMRSKGAFTVKNGFEDSIQNLQMSKESGTASLSSGKSGLILMGAGAPITQAHLMSQTVLITATDTIHLDADRISLNANFIDLNKGPQIEVRDFSILEDLPIGEGLAPCDALEDDKEIEFLTNNSGAGGGVNLVGAGGVGGGSENITDEPDTDDGDDDTLPPDDDDDGGFGEDKVPAVPSSPGGAGLGGGEGGDGETFSSPPPPGGDTLQHPPTLPTPSAPSAPPALPVGSPAYTPGASGTPSVPNAPTPPNPTAPPPPPNAPTTPGVAITPASGPKTYGPTGWWEEDDDSEEEDFGDDDGEGGGTPPPPPPPGVKTDDAVLTEGEVKHPGGGDGGDGEDDGPTITYMGQGSDMTDVKVKGGMTPNPGWFSLTGRDVGGGTSESEGLATVRTKDSLSISTTRPAQKGTQTGANTGDLRSDKPTTSSSKITSQTQVDTATGGDADIYGR